MKKNIFAVLFAVFGISSTVFAVEIANTDSVGAIVSAFQKYKEVGVLNIKVPTVVEVPFSEDFANRFNFAVIDTATNTFQPYLFIDQSQAVRTPVSVSVRGVSDGAMTDGSSNTFTEFVLPQSGAGQAYVSLIGAKTMSLDGMTFFFDQYVALPTFIEIHAKTGSGDRVVLARTPMLRNSVMFPKTSAREWTVILTHSQPLRITEFVLHEGGAGMINARALRFLAQPEHNYRVYFDADRSVIMNVGEAGNLSLNTGVIKVGDMPAVGNSAYTPADMDSDGIFDLKDNCVSVANKEQADVDVNGRGDACDDFDRDGIVNSVDNCPNEPNYNQADADHDNIGDVCDNEENRFTEKYPWLPWAGMGFAGLVLVVLFAVMARSVMKEQK